MKNLLFLSLAPISLLAGDWADSMLASLTLEEKIGQLFAVSACPTRGDDHWADWERLIDEFHVGGLLIKSGERQALQETVAKLQKLSPIPLLTMADAEWGMGMTSSSFVSFPRNMTLGAVRDLSLISEMGYQVGLQCRSIGVHLNLAPVADVNNNPDNPIIHMRSFGEDPNEVSERADAYTKGLQKAGVMACAKHFPGHGDTAIDSHLSLPTIPWDRKRLDEIELAPFKYLSDRNVDAVMTAHLLVPCIDPEWPTSLSKRCIQGVLRNDLSFTGLVITDALNMQGVAAFYSTEEIARRAHCAGNDVLLYGSHIGERIDDIIRNQVPRAYRALLELYRSGDRPIEELDKTVHRILEAKEKVFQTSLQMDPAECQALKKRLFEAAVTVLGDICLQDPIAYLGIGRNETDLLALEFHRKGIPLFKMDGCDPGNLDFFSKYKTVVIGLHDILPRALRYNLSKEIESAIRELSCKTNVIVCLFGTPYALRYLQGQKVIIVGYEDEPEAQSAVLRILNGEIKPIGQLPVDCYR